MIIKAVANVPPEDPAVKQPFPLPYDFVIETDSYHRYQLDYSSTEERDEFLQGLDASWNIPLGRLAQDVYAGESHSDKVTKVKSIPGRCVALRIPGKKEIETYVFESCQIYVMNEEGKTVDAFSS